MAVALWNLVGAGLLGFVINPPFALYCVQGLNLTPVHGHTALLGVYGMLDLGFTQFCLRVLQPSRIWKVGILKAALWSISLGLVFMVVLSMLPIGIMQAWASSERGTGMRARPSFSARLSCSRGAGSGFWAMCFSPPPRHRWAGLCWAS